VCAAGIFFAIVNYSVQALRLSIGPTCLKGTPIPTLVNCHPRLIVFADTKAFSLAVPSHRQWPYQNKIHPANRPRSQQKGDNLQSQNTKPSAAASVPKATSLQMHVANNIRHKPRHQIVLPNGDRTDRAERRTVSVGSGCSAGYLAHSRRARHRRRRSGARILRRDSRIS
jgi:hypothetical protein